MQIYQKRDSSTSVLLWILQIFQNNLFTQDLQATAFENKKEIRLSLINVTQGIY